MSEHLGYEKHDRAGRDGGNSRNGPRTKTVLTGIGPVEIEVPRDTESSFEPQIVKKRQRRLNGIDEAEGPPRKEIGRRSSRSSPKRPLLAFTPSPKGALTWSG